MDSVGATADFRLLAGQVEACLARFGWSELRTETCAGVQIGQSRAAGSAGLVRSEEDTRHWGAALGLQRASFELIAPFRIDLSAGLLVPWVRRNYEFQNPSRQLHEVPVLAGFGGLAISAQID